MIFVVGELRVWCGFGSIESVSHKATVGSLFVLL